MNINCLNIRPGLSLETAINQRNVAHEALVRAWMQVVSLTTDEATGLMRAKKDYKAAEVMQRVMIMAARKVCNL
jgi:hypothetical protein